MTEENELQQKNFDYQSYIETTTSSFVSKIFHDGILNEVELKTLKNYFANPDNYQKELAALSEYYYVSNGEIFQLFDMSKVLPTLNYKIDSFDKSNKQFEKNMTICNKAMYKARHKNLTRDIISQTISAGTLCGIWLGEKNNPYFYVFDDLNYIFPSYRLNGEWVVTVDMAWLELMSETERKITLKNLKPFITELDYKTYTSNREKYKYKDLPQDRTSVITTHTLKRNQNRGLSWATQGLYDILHKKKLKDLEKAVANKIINAIAVLTIGDEKDPDYKNLKLPKPVKRKIHTGVKTALEKSESEGITVVTIPEFAKIAFPEVKFGDSLDPKKFESVNSDILSSLGISPALISGTGGNFASAKINLEVFYKRLAVLLEDIESQVYSKLFNIVLPANQEDNFFLTYDKEPPISNKERIDILMKLHTQEGFSLKAVVDSLNGIDFQDYVDQSIYEQEVMDLPNKIQPYLSAYTSTGDDEVGRPSDELPVNENTERTKENDANSLPD